MGGLLEARSFEMSLGNTVRPYIHKQLKKLAGHGTVVIPTQEAYVGGKLEHRSLRIQSAMTIPVHYTLCNTGRPCL